MPDFLIHTGNPATSSSSLTHVAIPVVAQPVRTIH